MPWVPVVSWTTLDSQTQFTSAHSTGSNSGLVECNPRFYEACWNLIWLCLCRWTQQTGFRGTTQGGDSTGDTVGHEQLVTVSIWSTACQQMSLLFMGNVTNFTICPTACIWILSRVIFLFLPSLYQTWWWCHLVEFCVKCEGLNLSNQMTSQKTLLRVSTWWDTKLPMIDFLKQMMSHQQTVDMQMIFYDIVLCDPGNIPQVALYLLNISSYASLVDWMSLNWWTEARRCAGHASEQQADGGDAERAAA